MRVFKKPHARKWTIEVKDHLHIARKIPGLPGKRESEGLGKQIATLAYCKRSHLTPDPDTARWLESIPEKLQRRLIQIGLLDQQRAAARNPLAVHIEDWHNALAAKGDAAKHCDFHQWIVQRIMDTCGFKSLSDVSASRVLSAIDGFRKSVDTVDDKKNHKRKDLGPVSGKTKLYYLRAIKGFFRWMVKEQRISTNPIDHLSLNVDSKQVVRRRALSVDEIACLLAFTKAAGPRYGMDGYSRGVLYQVAVLTGLRAGELRELTVGNFNLDGKTVTLAGEHTKNGEDAALPLRADLVAELRLYLTSKMPGEKAFTMPHESSVPRMLRKDMADARMDWVSQDPKAREESDFLLADTADGRIDFHGLRHTYGSLLASAGVHPKKAQELMRHSDINLTMSRYTHIFAGQGQEAVESLPDFEVTQGKDGQRKVS